MNRQKRNLILFVINATSHPCMGMSNVKLVFFSPNTTTHLVRSVHHLYNFIKRISPSFIQLYIETREFILGSTNSAVIFTNIPRSYTYTSSTDFGSWQFTFGKKFPQCRDFATRIFPRSSDHWLYHQRSLTCLRPMPAVL